jgi:D-arabinose 1-dehydrogenase-like Zn-dependent alcohol dehydrogenase
MNFFLIELLLRPLPRVVGHEGIGEVVELGANVGEHIRKGDIIGVW